ncbi:MAG: thiosulfate oxidation carrier complex protein SoxZ [Burkholderiales bacterium]
MARTLITMPKTAKRGELIEIRTLIAHPMETGYRHDDGGVVVPRNLIRRLSCRYFDGRDDVEVFSAELFPAIAANPYVSFFTIATGSGTLRFSWQGDDGFAQTESVELSVT